MTVTIESPDLASVQAWTAGLLDLANREAVNGVLDESQALMSDVEMMMPQDTGWASRRWGNPTEYGIWEVSDDGLAIEQGSDLSEIGMYEYITRLNEGSSMQAPAGFIDSAAERAGDKLEARLDEIATTLDNS